MYLQGPNANFEITIPVEQTDEYTVEFWFRPGITDWSAADANYASDKVTYLYTMQGSGSTSAKQKQSNQEPILDN